MYFVFWLQEVTLEDLKHFKGEVWGMKNIQYFWEFLFCEMASVCCKTAGWYVGSFCLASINFSKKI